MKISTKQALSKLAEEKKLFTTLFSHGSLEVEVYKPDHVDNQQPHSRDEIYVIIAGNGTFYNNGLTTDCSSGDFLFVKAGHEHRFTDFSDNFATWVFFYGPEGGE